MNKICVYAITKNEEQFVERWYNSMKEADSIVVLDTGSTDNTVVKLRELGAKKMRKPIIAGNWKMFKTRDEAINFILQVNDKMPSIDEVDSVICAQFTVLRCLVKRQLNNLRIGAQNGNIQCQREYGKLLKAENDKYAQKRGVFWLEKIRN